jgi:hypothetical protein
VSRRLHYELDGRLSRTAGTHLTFHDLAPGRHRLAVVLSTGGQARASTTFTVRAPVPVPAPEPAPAQEAAPPASSSPAPSSSKIPQNNGGDADEDNNGGPSDGDGNL